MVWSLNNGRLHPIRLLEGDKLTWYGSVLCGDYGIKQIDEPFIHDADDRDEWSV